MEEEEEENKDKGKDRQRDITRMAGGGLVRLKGVSQAQVGLPGSPQEQLFHNQLLLPLNLNTHRNKRHL